MSAQWLTQSNGRRVGCIPWGVDFRAAALGPESRSRSGLMSPSWDHRGAVLPSPQGSASLGWTAWPCPALCSGLTGLSEAQVGGWRSVGGGVPGGSEIPHLQQLCVGVSQASTHRLPGSLCMSSARAWGSCSQGRSGVRPGRGGARPCRWWVLPAASEQCFPGRCLPPHGHQVAGALFARRGPRCPTSDQD